MAKPKPIILILLALVLLAVVSLILFFSFTSTSHSQNLSASSTAPPPSPSHSEDLSTSTTTPPPSTSPTAPSPSTSPSKNDSISISPTASPPSASPSKNLSTAPTRPLATTPPPQVGQACKATRNPLACEATLNKSPDLPADPTPLELVQRSLTSTIQALQKTYSMTKFIGDSPTVGNPNVTDSARSCLEGLSNAEYRLNSTAAALPRGKLKDGRAWVSAALAYEYGCWAGLNNLLTKQIVNDTRLVNETVVFMNSTLITLTSNSLSMLFSYDIFGDKLDLWSPPKTERDGFWEKGATGLAFKGGFPTGLKPDVTVCKENGAGCLKSVQEAVNKTPDWVEGRRFVIKINKGVYEEIVRVPIEKKNVVFLGDGMGNTVITGALTVGQPGMNTYRTATVGVVGDGFMARDITFQNTAGPQTFQAVAFRSSSDLSIIENCEFLGHQDTLYVHSLRQFYKSCRIEGNVDFIFGNAAAIIQDSIILIRPRQQNPEQGETNPVTAHGRTDPAQSTGIVIQNSVINGTEEYLKLYHSNPKVHKNYLGRPWKEYCRTVFIHCTLGDLISSDGWQIWDGDFALATVYYGEFENTGPGADVTHRVPWSNQIPKEHVLTYSVESFIQGNEWIATS